MWIGAARGPSHGSLGGEGAPGKNDVKDAFGTSEAGGPFPFSRSRDKVPEGRMRVLGYWRNSARSRSVPATLHPSRLRRAPFSRSQAKEGALSSTQDRITASVLQGFRVSRTAQSAASSAGCILDTQNPWSERPLCD